MYKDFSDYWETKKLLFEKLGVDKEVARLIWSDSVNCLGMQLIIKQIK